MNSFKMSSIIKFFTEFKDKELLQIGKILLGLAGILILLFFFLFGIMKTFKRTFIPAQISSINTLTGAIAFESEGKQHIHYLLPTCELWSPSGGIEVKKGDRITIRASGKYHPAIHHLVEYGNVDTSLELPWLGPKGLPMDSLKSKPKHEARAELRIHKYANFGELIAQFVPDKPRICSGKPKPINHPTDEQLKTNFYTNNRDFIKGNTIKISKKGSLFFAVNEPIIDSSNKKYEEAYIFRRDTLNAKNGTKKRAEIDSLIKIREFTWPKIERARDWDLWFKDNVGFLLIIIEIESKKCN